MLELAKRTEGKQLSPAEHRQRVDAARARWGVLAAGTAVGGVAGFHVGFLRQAIRNQDRLVGVAGGIAANIVDAQNRAGAAAERAGGRHADAIRDAVAFRLRTNPESKTERQARTLEVLSGRPRAPAPGRAQPPVIGSAENIRIYDYELERQGRHLRREESHLARLKGLVDQEFEDAAPARPAPPARGIDLRPEPRSAARDMRTVATRVQELKTEVQRLERLKEAAHARITRAGSIRRGEPVAAHVARQFRGGETLRQIKQRITTARAFERTRGNRLLDMSAARTARASARARETAFQREVAAVADAYRTGEYGSRLLRAAGKHSAIGAGIGLTVTGLGLLAHHVVTAYRRHAPLEKSENGPPTGTNGESDALCIPGTIESGTDGQLAKASKAETAATKLAAQFRAWIDRLLGKNEAPMNLGDGIAGALGGIISDSFAHGAVNSQVDEAASDPRYRIDVDFDVLNPAVRRHMAEYALDRIVAITSQQREAIRTALMQQSVLQGIGPRDVARTIRLSIGLTAYQAGVVQSFRSQLVALDPRALNRKLRDKRYDRTVQRAIETGVPLTDDQVDAMTDAYHRRMLAFRAETIARTESIKATSYGAVARAQQVLDAHPELDVIKGWLATDDERTRDTHRELNGKEVQGMLTPWITTAGNRLRWPHDELAPADEVIDCRCATLFRFIPRRGQLQAVAV